jgi:hypothetical protein
MYPEAVQVEVNVQFVTRYTVVVVDTLTVLVPTGNESGDKKVPCIDNKAPAPEFELGMVLFVSDMAPPTTVHDTAGLMTTCPFTRHNPAVRDKEVIVNADPVVRETPLITFTLADSISPTYPAAMDAPDVMPVIPFVVGLKVSVPVVMLELLVEMVAKLEIEKPPMSMLPVIVIPWIVGAILKTLTPVPVLVVREDSKLAELNVPSNVETPVANPVKDDCG